MAKAMRRLEDLVEIRSWLTANFGRLNTKELGPGVYVTTARKTVRISDGRLLRTIEGDGRTPEHSIRDFYGIVTGVKPEQQLVVGKKVEERFALDPKTLMLKAILN